MANFFTYAERISLQKFLAECLSFKEIGRTLGKDPTTISREVRRHMSQVASGRPGYPYNPCKHRKSCRAKNICGRSGCHGGV
jgi:IS30 family transposase